VHWARLQGRVASAAARPLRFGAERLPAPGRVDSGQRNPVSGLFGIENVKGVAVDDIHHLATDGIGQCGKRQQEYE
jgi:hypothetical protein